MVDFSHFVEYSLPVLQEILVTFSFSRISTYSSSPLHFQMTIGEQNTELRKYFRLFIRGLDGVESWKLKGSKISWHTPFEDKMYCENN